MLPINSVNIAEKYKKKIKVLPPVSSFKYNHHYHFWYSLLDFYAFLQIEGKREILP